MARLLVWICMAIAVYAVNASDHDDHGRPVQVHNYYGDVHNHQGYPNGGHHDDHHDDDHHDDDHHDDDHHDDDHHDDDHHNDDHHEDEEHDPHHGDDHVYRFRVDNDFPGYSYKNDKGAVVGFSSELLTKVCERAHKHCHWMVDTFTNCWSTKDGSHPGQGLVAGWYDGCVGVVPTQERLNSFNFTESFSEPVHWRLYFKGTHEGNLDGVKVGFVDGFSMTPECFEKHFDGDYEAVTVPSLGAMFEAIEDGTVDAMPTEDNDVWASKHHLVPYGDPYMCSEEGLAVMVHYGSDVPRWWNTAFESLVASGEFREFCQHQQLFHGHSGAIHCNH